MSAADHTAQVAVIVPTFDRAALVGRAIESILSQTYPVHSIVVVDDGSRDETSRLVSAIGGSRVRLIRHPTNRGAAAARNTGLRAVDCQYVAFLDSDDVWRPEKLARQVQCLDSSPASVIACGTGIEVERDDGSPLEQRACAAGDLGLDAIIVTNHLSIDSTMLIERSAFDQVGYFDEDLRRLEDWEWLLRFATRYQIRMLPETLVKVSVGRREFLADRTALAARKIVEMQRDRLGRTGGAVLRRIRAHASWQVAWGYHTERRPGLALVHGAKALVLSPAGTLPLLLGWLRRAATTPFRAGTARKREDVGLSGET